MLGVSLKHYDAIGELSGRRKNEQKRIFGVRLARAFYEEDDSLSGSFEFLEDDFESILELMRKDKAGESFEEQTSDLISFEEIPVMGFSTKSRWGAGGFDMFLSEDVRRSQISEELDRLAELLPGRIVVLS